MRTYRDVLSIPGVAKTIGTSLLARLPFGAIDLVLILRVREVGHGYGAAGLVAGGFLLFNGLTSPALGRLIDRLGQTPVLLVGSAVAGGGTAGLALLGAGAPIAAFVGLSSLVGAAIPPLNGCVRVLLGDLVPEPAQRHAVYSLESSAYEIVFLVGPLGIVGGIATQSPRLAIATCAALIVAGTLAFASLAASRRWRPAPGDRRRSRLGAVRHGGVRTLLITMTLVGTSFGAVEVSTVAFAQHHRVGHAVGPLLALWGFASLVGGVVVGRFGPALVPARRIAVLLAAMAGADGLLLAAPSLPVLVLGLIGSGATIAPLGSQVFNLVGVLAPEGATTESITWLATGLSGGTSLGSALGGALIGAGGARAGYAVAVAALLGGFACVRGAVTHLRPAAVPAQDSLWAESLAEGS